MTNGSSAADRTRMENIGNKGTCLQQERLKAAGDERGLSHDPLSSRECRAHGWPSIGWWAILGAWVLLVLLLLLFLLLWVLHGACILEEFFRSLDSG